MGVDKGDRVSLFLKNPLVTTLSMYALWKIGAVFCPINFLYQGRLLSYQINDTRPRLLITESGREPILNQIKSEIGNVPVVIHRPKKGEHDYREDGANLKLDASFKQTLFEELLSGDSTNPGVKVNYWDTANIVYTSGTTGPPKGVVQSYRWMQNYCFYGTKMLHPDDVVYCDLPLYHIGGAFALVGRAAWRGCTVAVWDRFSPSDFWNRIKVSGGSYCLLLDVMMPRLLQPDPRPDDLENTLNRAHMQPLPEYHHRFSKRFGIDFVNVGYGATEIGYACAAIIDESRDEKWTPDAFRKGYTKQEVADIAAELGLTIVPGDKEIKKGFMGTACMFHELAILGEHDEKLGAGEYGQIGMRSRLPSVLLDEYFNRPEATAEVFRNLWFHTGDGAYRDEEGIFYFVDRMGGFIRVKGENISSFQVEDIINAHPDVSVCAAFPVPAAEGLEDDIVVYVVPAPDKTLTEEALAAWIKTEMPRYMQPKHLRFVDALPETPTHKVEKYKLKEMFLAEG
jgi:crotonobetaine/carnitine-CoA ligase